MSNQVLANNATKLSLSTPKELDLLLIIGEIASTKTNVGISLRGKHGEQSLFSGVCAFVKSMRGLGKQERLDDETVAIIQNAIAEFWKIQANKVLTYGEVDSVTFDKPSAIFADDGKIADIRKNATIKTSASTDGKERQFFSLCLLNSAKKRLNVMKERPSVYDRNHLAKQELRIAALEHEYQRMVELNK